MKPDKTTARKCPICGGFQAEILRKQSFVLPEGHPLVAGYNVVCCCDCGCVYADTDVSQADYDAFYSAFSKYEDRSTTTGGGDTPWDAERLRQTARDIALFLPDKAARILDIGCANGGLLQALREMGYPNVHGLDPSHACVQNVSGKGLPASIGTLSSLPKDIGDFECVILSHVLEHVRELPDALKDLEGVVGRDGIVYAEVPDASRYAEFLTAPFQDFNTEHINHFSGVGLRNVLAVSGWESQAIRTKDILSAPKMPYPAVFAVAKRAAAVYWVRDTELRGRIVEYIQRSQAMLDGIDRILRRELPENGELIVWGTGQLTMKLLVETSLRDARITAFVDGNPINQGRALRGIPVLSPGQLRGRTEPILISTIIHQQEVLKAIREVHHLGNPVILIGSGSASQGNPGN
ncbi:MAG: class I SAM-dependent methyltransferase [bacterium]